MCSLKTILSVVFARVGVDARMCKQDGRMGHGTES